MSICEAAIWPLTQRFKRCVNIWSSNLTIDTAFQTIFFTIHMQYLHDLMRQICIYKPYLSCTFIILGNRTVFLCSIAVLNAVSTCEAAIWPLTQRFKCCVNGHFAASGVDTAFQTIFFTFHMQYLHDLVRQICRYEPYLSCAFIILGNLTIILC